VLNIDLHSHSTRSPGRLAPAELAARAASRGLMMFALTDHDEVDGLEEARAAAEAYGIVFINGVEISVTWNDRTLHVVGLHIDPREETLARGLRTIREGRDRRAAEIAVSLERAGVSGSLRGALAYVTNPALVGRTHFARYLVEQGHARDMQSAFRKYLTAGNPGYVAHRWAGLEEAVRWIRTSGGVAVLAHPGRYKLASRERESLLGDFRDAGGDAIEVVTGSHSESDYAMWGCYAARFGLRASCGSDFHGVGESRLDLGRLPPLPAGCVPVWKHW
jgi:predicted metal-dependent phosphoesterase TrpH